ncbi:MAG: amino acid ABC transporter permease [Caldisericaceae bacterium]|jgi:polar amino acid transport system permease protein|nr:amino acid ABC transporter permease [Caldisericaceae bacterium]
MHIIANFDKIWASLPFLLGGLPVTLSLTAIAGLIGIGIGLLLALMKISKNKILRGIALVYIDAFRGTPLLLQIMIFYYAIPIKNMSAFASAVVALSLNSAAYVAEILRAGIESIAKGQMEAALSVGMTYGQAMRYIILPQTIKRVIPPTTNNIVALMKDTSLVMVIGLSEIVYKAKQIGSATANFFAPLLMAAILYLVFTIPLTRYAEKLEGRFSKGD